MPFAHHELGKLPMVKNRVKMGIYIMVNDNMLIDENMYEMAWRFNLEDCLLSDEEKLKIIFLNKSISSALWFNCLPFNHLMQINDTHFTLQEKLALDFSSSSVGGLYFSTRLERFDTLFFFWSKLYAAIVPKNIFLKSWDDFFYPSDENSIICIPNEKDIIFSFEDSFFYGHLE